MYKEEEPNAATDPPGSDVQLNRTCGTYLHRTSSRCSLLFFRLLDSRRQEVYSVRIKRRSSTRM